ncbi:MAG: UDP-3-O-(3-hydroxymyristoyl)glucosamine N-acyltransferase [Pseudomonadales bacterium]|nr:UDP-3-O-(3-hydroxymyristoyl)glucosamine N-acyltransferase [Pseudomonadales bacterium]
MTETPLAIAEIAEILEAKVIGDASSEISSLATLQAAKTGQLAFLSNPVYKKHLAKSQASAIIVAPDVITELVEERDGSWQFVSDEPLQSTFLVLDNPYLGFAKLTHLFDTAYQFEPRIETSAVIHPSVQIPDDCYIGHNAVIGEGCVLGRSVYIGANVSIGVNCHIGDRTRLWASVVLYSDITLGQDCIIHSGVVIGSDGFGNAKDGEKWFKIAQLGGVTIGDNVEVGANTTIDRGALGDTIIGDGVRIDNQVQIAHNVVIGDDAALAGCVGVAGSTTIGKRCVIGGATGIGGHLDIADDVYLTGMTMVTKSIKSPGLYSSGTGVEPNSKWRRMVARMRSLDEFAKKLKSLERKVDSLLG